MKWLKSLGILLILLPEFLCLESSFSEELKLPIQTGHETAIAWSRDSSKVAIGAYNNIYIIDGSSGEVLQAILVSGFNLEIDWSPDGKKLAVSHTDEVTVHYPADIFIIDLTDGTAENVTQSKPYTYCRAPKWSPDGSFIVFTFEKRDTILHEDSDELEHVFTEEVATLNLETGDFNTLGTGCCPEWSKDRRKLVIRCRYDCVETYSIDYVEESQELFPDTKTLLTTEQRQWLQGSINATPQKLRQFSCDEECLSPDGAKLVIKISTSLDHFSFVLKKE